MGELLGAVCDFEGLEDKRCPGRRTIHIFIHKYLCIYPCDVLLLLGVWWIPTNSSGAQLLWRAAAAVKALMRAVERIEHRHKLTGAWKSISEFQMCEVLHTEKNKVKLKFND